MKLTRRIVLSALTLAVALAAVSPAGADIKFNNSVVNPNCSMRFTIEGIKDPGACTPIVNAPLPPGSEISRFCLGIIDPANNKIVAQARNVGGSCSSTVWAYGDAQAGGDNQIESPPDTVIASVGLYTAPGGTALLPPPAGTGSPDSLMRVNVGRSGTTVTLTFPTINVGGVNVGAGGMQVRAANPNETTIAEFRLIVYANQAAADGDINTDGFGSAFMGRVVLQAGSGVATGLSTYGGFTNADFILQPHGGGKFTVRPIAGLTRNVIVPDANDAVVVLFSDPRSLQRPVAVPSSTPLGLALLSLALMGSGLWVIRSRRSAETA